MARFCLKENCMYFFLYLQFYCLSPKTLKQRKFRHWVCSKIDSKTQEPLKTTPISCPCVKLLVCCINFSSAMTAFVKMINLINVQLLVIEPGNQQIPQNNLQATSLQLFASTYLFNYHMYQNSLRSIKFCFSDQTVFSNLELRPYFSAVRKSVISPDK